MPPTLRWPVAGARKQAVTPTAPTCGAAPSLQGISAASRVVPPRHRLPHTLPLPSPLARVQNIRHGLQMNCTLRIYGELCKTPVWPNQLWGLRSRTSLLTPAEGGTRQAGDSTQHVLAAWWGAWRLLRGPESPWPPPLPSPFPSRPPLTQLSLRELSGSSSLGLTWGLSPPCPGGYCYHGYQQLWAHAEHRCGSPSWPP